LPVDLVYPQPPQLCETADLEQYVRNFQETTLEAFDIVRQNLGAAAELRKERYDCKVKAVPEFRPGDKVWYFYPRRVQGKSSKWQKWYVGPYEVLKAIDSHNLVIQKRPKSKPKVVHRDKLKMCHLPSVVSDDDSDTYLDSTRIRGDEVAPFDEADPLESGANNDDFNRRRRLNKRQPFYLRDYVCPCVCIGPTMASRQVQIPSGKPYCFVCNTSFQSTYNLNCHNASYRQKHAEIQARMEELQAAQMDEASQPSNIATVNSSTSPQVYRVRTVYTTATVRRCSTN
jgi:hypothetical protein